MFKIRHLLETCSNFVEMGSSLFSLAVHSKREINENRVIVIGCNAKLLKYNLQKNRNTAPEMLDPSQIAGHSNYSDR